LQTFNGLLIETFENIHVEKNLKRTTVFRKKQKMLREIALLVLMIRYSKAILLPYIIRKRFELGLFDNQTAIAIFDVHTSHRYNTELHSILRQNFVEFIYVPACCTSELQPLDADGGPNYQLKSLLKNEFSMWYTTELLKQIQIESTANAPSTSTTSNLVTDSPSSKFTLNASKLKSLHALWFHKCFEELKKPQFYVVLDENGNHAKDIRNSNQCCCRNSFIYRFLIPPALFKVTLYQFHFFLNYIKNQGQNLKLNRV